MKVYNMKTGGIRYTKEDSNDINTLVEMKKFDSIDQVLKDVVSYLNPPHDNKITHAMDDLMDIKNQVIDMCDGFGIK